MLRLFIAIRPPEWLRDQLLDLQPPGLTARWVDADALHLTLRFIGEVEPWQADDVHGALADIDADPFTITTSGVGVFDGGAGSQVLWAGIAANPALHHLRDKVDRACVAAGLAPDRRKFKPHLTLGRLPRARRGAQDDVGAFLALGGDFSAPAFRAETFWLVQSELGAKRAHYTPLARYPLGPKGPLDDLDSELDPDEDLNGWD